MGTINGDSSLNLCLSALFQAPPEIFAIAIQVIEINGFFTSVRRLTCELSHRQWE
jgi:hypothetical protein